MEHYHDGDLSAHHRDPSHQGSIRMRRTDREVTDPAVIRYILEMAKILHLGLFDDGYPYVVPLHYGYVLAENRLVFYLHSAKEGHKLDLIRENPHVCTELACDFGLVSGGENPCSYGAAYASLIGRGTAEIVTDVQEKCRGLSLLMQHQTGRAFSFTGEMAAAVAVIKITLDTFTAKSRPKP